jgi:hypothetical protein
MASLGVGGDGDGWGEVRKWGWWCGKCGRGCGVSLGKGGCWFPHRYIVMCFFLSLFAMLLVGGAYDPFRSGPEDHHPGGDIPWCKSEIDTLNT